MQVDEVAWFRTLDNNPVIIDDEVIDSGSFSRSQLSYPSGSSFAANANILVSFALGHSHTQSAMYSSQFRGQHTLGLAADDVNMVRMGMSGSDRLAGTADDYLWLLSYESDCANAEIEVSYVDFGTPAAVGNCAANIALSFPQAGTRFHYSVIPFGANSKMLIQINSNAGLDLDFSTTIFWDNFETGDDSEWTPAKAL